MTKAELQKLLTTPDWRWGTSEGAELHTLLLGLASTFREKLEWLEEAETLSLQFRANREKSRQRKRRGKIAGAPRPLRARTRQ
jgi:hypothetical protein